MYIVYMSCEGSGSHPYTLPPCIAGWCIHEEKMICKYKAYLVGCCNEGYSECHIHAIPTSDSNLLTSFDPYPLMLTLLQPLQPHPTSSSEHHCPSQQPRPNSVNG